MTMPELAMTYIVYWPASQVMKVGRAYRSARLGSFVATGAQLISVVRDTPKVWESAAHTAFRETFPRAFAHADESRRLLSRGRGWTECYRVAPNQIGAAVTVFKKAVAPYAIHPEEVIQARDVQPRRALPIVAAPAAPIHDEPADVRGRCGQRGGEFEDAQGAVLRVRSGCDGQGRRCDAPRVGGPRLVAAVHLGATNSHAGEPCGDVRVSVDRRSGLSFSSARTRPGGHPEGTLGRLRAECGRGEGARGGCRGREGVPRLDARPGDASPAGLSSSSEQHGLDQLWGVWWCSEDPRSVHAWRDISCGGGRGLVDRGTEFEGERVGVRSSRDSVMEVAS